MKKIVPISLFKCPETGRLFEKEEQAEKSMRKFLTDKAKREKKEKLNLDIANSFRLELDDIRDFGQLLNEKVKKHMGIDPGIRVSSLLFGRVCNSSCAPVGGKSNWCARDKSIPSSYLGWKGKISGSYIKKGAKQFEIRSIIVNDSGWSDTLKADFDGFYGVNTGCGGGGSGCWSYDLSIFIDDFPLLKRKTTNTKNYNPSRPLTKRSSERKRTGFCPKRRGLMKFCLLITNWR